MLAVSLHWYLEHWVCSVIAALCQKSGIGAMRKFIQQPYFWCWLFVVTWGVHVIATLLMQRWQAAALFFVAFIAAAMVLGAIWSRRQKNLYPETNNKNKFT
jgi:hypothetical protein